MRHRPELRQRVRLGIQEDEVLLRQGQVVYDYEGEQVGSIDHLLVDPASGRVSHLIVRRSRRLSAGDDFVVPVEWVLEIGDRAVYLRETRSSLAPLATYRSVLDTQIQAQVVRSVETSPATRNQGLQVQVEHGLVRLLGEVPNAVAAAAELLAKRIRGVIGVEDRTTRAGQPAVRIGAPVYTLDGQAGVLARVVVDPNTRQVTHLVVAPSEFPDQAKVVPIALLDRAGPDGIYLWVNSVELDHESTSEMNRLTDPPENWA